MEDKYVNLKTILDCTRPKNTLISRFEIECAPAADVVSREEYNNLVLQLAKVIKENADLKAYLNEVIGFNQ